MPALIASRCSLIASSFQTDIILLNPRAETRSYRSLRPQLVLDRLLLRCPLAPLADTTSLVLLLRAPLAASPPPVPGQDPTKPLSRDRRLCPQLSSSCQGEVQLLLLYLCSLGSPVVSYASERQLSSWISKAALSSPFFV